MRYYPVHLDLVNRSVLVVGGGPIAEGKAVQLLEAGARLRLVSPDLTAKLNDLVGDGRIDHRAKTFEADDLDGVMLVISATNDREVNESVATAARLRGVWCNVVDEPGFCDFITPALVVRGGLQIGISTGGGSPVLAQRVKREIGELIGEEYGELLELAAGMRARAKHLISDFGERRDVLRAFVESEAIELLRGGRREEARQMIEVFLQKWREKDDRDDRAGNPEPGADRAVGA
jgi:siroheme synthase-like protein